MSDNTLLDLSDPPEVETVPCYSCGVPVVSSPLRLVDDQDLCVQCYLELSQCGRCDRPMIIRYRDVPGSEICSTCSADMFRCDQCEGYGDFDDLTTTGEYPDGAGVCEWCLENYFTQCVHCYTFVLNEDSTTVQGGDEVCRRCRRRDYWQCDCGDWVRDDYECEDCDTHSSLVHNYSYTPPLRFHGDGPVFLGMELEVNNADRRCAELANDYLGSLGYLKEDGSLTRGFEIVTHPMSHEYARENFPWDMLAELQRNGAETDEEDTGLHVHVSRKGFDSPAHVYRWMKLIYRNKQGVTSVARRSGSTWASFTDKARRDVKAYAKGERGAARYQAINVQNYATFEVRVFASSLNRREVQAALDLVAASVEYTRHLTVPVILAGGWDWPAFGKWVAENADKYAALALEADFSTTEPYAPGFTPEPVPGYITGCPCDACQASAAQWDRWEANV